MNTRNIILVSLSFALSQPLSAQTALEEITVTARKRVESLDDVPISVSVTTGQKLERMAIHRLEDLSAFTPNLQINENATQQSVTIRGIGSGANQAFEQSVGTYIDGVYFGRGRSARNPFFDVERVEILKGPQGILFGKNTIAGAVNVITRKPSSEPEGYIAGEYFTETDQWGITGVISGPLSDTLSGRIAANYRSAGGYIDNSLAGGDEPDRAEYVVRGTVVLEATPQLSVTLKGEFSSYDVDGRNAQMVAAGPLAGLYAATDPNFETELDYNSATPGDDFDNTDAGNVTLTVDYELGDSLTLTSITSYVEYDFTNNIPAEFAPVPDYAEQSNRQRHDQFSEELRLHYTSGDARFEFLGGLYYQTEDLSIEETFNFNFSNLIAAGVQFLPLDSSVITFFDQETDSFAAFGEATLSIIDGLRISAGLRYTEDDKQVDKELLVAALGTQTRAPGQEPLARVIGRIPHAYSLDRKDTDLSPSVGLQFDLSDDAMLYATWSQGFKAGGFDAQNVGGATQLAAFDPEEVEAWETGGKFTFLDGAVRLNLAYFNNQYEDLQVAAWNGFAFIVENAASATSQGVEADLQWRITEHFTLGGAIAWLDAAYDNFSGAVCTAPQQTAFAASTGRPAGQCSQDLSGKDLQFSPETAGNVNAEYRVPLGNYLLTLQSDVNFTAGYHTALDLDPLARQDGFAKLNARIELAAGDDRWSVALVGKNLTDQKSTTWVNDLPVFRGAYFGFIDPPRTVGVQARISM
ncbi:MAG: TonB-dependent receptor [Gammaproteobacteria bacterium]|nr:TonB-dependent receptor [Gammaproteobacteria bacterium]MCY4211224.1 TonB-dependent receptor [Gammaproteobacteria bacterium]MCY4282845.1 TonB-dependent receptor [Gammaproteobacteria bacterium]